MESSSAGKLTKQIRSNQPDHRAATQNPLNPLRRAVPLTCPIPRQEIRLASQSAFPLCPLTRLSIHHHTRYLTLHIHRHPLKSRAVVALPISHLIPNILTMPRHRLGRPAQNLSSSIFSSSSRPPRTRASLHPKTATSFPRTLSSTHRLAVVAWKWWLASSRCEPGPKY